MNKTRLNLTTKAIVLSIALAFAHASNAEGVAAKIKSVGCHNSSDGTCFVDLESAPFGPPSCSGSQFRINANTADGKRNYATILSAFMGGRTVYIFVSQSCFASQPNYPTIDWFSVL